MKICFNCSVRFSACCWNCPVYSAVPAKIRNFLAFNPLEAKNRAEYNPGFFSELACLAANNFWHSSRNRLIIWILKRYSLSIQIFLKCGAEQASF
jgi:hypothetical protein